MIASLRFAAVTAAGVLCAVPLAAQKHVPATYAITGARIVPVSGPAIDKGTIVIRDGVIAAVGATVTAPADARIIDGTGLTIYPGLIDAYGSLGQGTTTAAAAGAAAAGRGGRGGAATTTAAREAAPNSNYVVGLRPEVNVVDELNVESGEFDAAHNAGITTALTGVGNGIFRGQSALINLTGDSVSLMVIRSGVAQNIGFSRGGGGGGGGRGGYPGTLFGVFATLRQEFLDAQHYRDVKAAYDRNPRGMRRPDFDASLEALQPVLKGDEPVILQANTEREIIRALDLADEFHLKPIIAGGAESYKLTARLKAENVPVLLSLSFPRAGAAGGAAGGGGGRGGGGAEPGDPEPLRMLRERVMQTKGPKTLADAGVKVAFESGADYTNMLANLRKSVTAGLTQEQALRAITWSPAELFGVSDRLGSIEAGKIANLTITKGDIFDADGRVTQLFVDGRPVTITPPAAAGNAGGGRGGNRPGVDASGAWSMSVTIDHHDYTVLVHIYQSEGRIYGVVEGDLGSSDILNGEIDADGAFYFTATLSLHGSDEFEFDGTLDRTGMRGQVTSEEHAGSFAGAHSN